VSQFVSLDNKLRALRCFASYFAHNCHYIRIPYTASLYHFSFRHRGRREGWTFRVASMIPRRWAVMLAVRVWVEGVRRRLPIMFLQIVMIVSIARVFVSWRVVFTTRLIAMLVLSGRAQGSEQGTMISWGLGGLQIRAGVLVLALAEGFWAI
jgi:hypothetical protein